MAKLNSDFYDFNKMRAVGYLTDWTDIKEGNVYHIPPTILYARRDIAVVRKESNHIYGKVYDYETGKETFSTIYFSEISARYLILKK